MKGFLKDKLGGGRALRLRRAGIPLVLLVLLSLAGVVLAQGGGYDLSWWTVDGGGDTLSDNGYTLDGTIGQPDAAGWSGDGYTLAGGFWGGEVGIAAENELFLPLIMRNLSV